MCPIFPVSLRLAGLLCIGDAKCCTTRLPVCLVAAPSTLAVSHPLSFQLAQHTLSFHYCALLFPDLRFVVSAHCLTLSCSNESTTHAKLTSWPLHSLCGRPRLVSYLRAIGGVFDSHRISKPHPALFPPFFPSGTVPRPTCPGIPQLQLYPPTFT